MKKVFALVLILCMLFTVTAAMADDLILGTAATSGTTKMMVITKRINLIEQISDRRSIIG